MKPRERAKDARLRREFGLTLRDYNIIFERQDKCCAICLQPRSKFKNDLAVDHDHKTGLVRGLLCMTCNRALGKWRDNDELVIGASLYVQSPPAVAALGRRHITAPGRCGTKVRAKLLAKSKKGANG